MPLESETVCGDSPLLALPDEILFHIFSYLRPRDVAMISFVCHFLRGFVQERRIRKSLQGYPYRYVVFQPRVTLSSLEQDSSIPVLEFLKEEGFCFLSLEDEDLKILKEMKQMARDYLNKYEKKTPKERREMQYCCPSKTQTPVGYAEIEELHGYLTRIYKPKKFPWPHSSKQEKKTAQQFWQLMVRICCALLKCIAYSLDIPFELLVPILGAQSMEAEMWLKDKIVGECQDGRMKNSSVQISQSGNKTSKGGRRRTQKKVLFSKKEKEEEWDKPVLKMYHFRERHGIRPNFRTVHEYSRGLFKLVSAYNDGITPCGVQMLMPRPPNSAQRNYLPLFKLAREGDIAIFGGFALSRLCQAFSVSLGVRPIYLTANIGCEGPKVASNSVFMHFDAHVSYPLLYQAIHHASNFKGLEWKQPTFEKVRTNSNKEFFNKRNPFGAFWFRQITPTKKESEKLTQRRKARWAVAGSALAAIAVPVMLVATPLWLPLGGMAWLYKKKQHS